MAQLLECAEAIGLPDDPEYRSAFVGHLESRTRPALVDFQLNSLPDVDPAKPARGWREVGGPYRRMEKSTRNSILPVDVLRLNSRHALFAARSAAHVTGHSRRLYSRYLRDRPHRGICSMVQSWSIDSAAAHWAEAAEKRSESRWSARRNRHWRERMMRIFNLGVQILAAFCVLAPRFASAQNPSADFGSNAARLRTGIFVYQDRNHDDGAVVGSSRILIRRVRNESDYEFSNLATFASGFLGFHSQRWTAVASAQFQPRSAVLSFLNGNEVAPIFDITYRAGKATGFVVSRLLDGTSKKFYVNDPVPADTVDQRIDWATVIANDLKVGRHFEFNVYDPKSGVGHVQADVAALSNVHVAAGDFVSYAIDYRIHKTNGVEHFRVFASKETPRFMVREEFPNGVVTDLIRIENAAQPN